MASVRGTFRRAHFVSLGERIRRRSRLEALRYGRLGSLRYGASGGRERAAQARSAGFIACRIAVLPACLGVGRAGEEASVLIIDPSASRKDSWRYPCEARVLRRLRQMLA